MKKISIFNAVLSVLLVLFLLTGCSSIGGKEPIDETKLQSNDESTGADIKVDDNTEENNYSESTELTYLRLQIKENNALVGVAYLDFLTNTDNVSEYSLAVDRSTSAMFDKYPFLERCPISVNEGNVMLAVVPSSKSATVTVYRSEIDSEGMFNDDRSKPLFQSKDGAPIVLLCNDNENYSNVLISVEDGDKVVEFRPMLSMKNGRDLVLSDGCYDFTYWDIRGYSDAAYYYLSTYIDEIREDLANGMSLSYDSQEFMYNHYGLKYRLGKYNEDGNYECEKEYIIDEYYTLVHDMSDGGNSWQVVGGGLSSERLADILAEID